MLQRFEYFGLDFLLYPFFFKLGMFTVPVVLLFLRKRFRFSLLQYAFYSLFTLGFGFLSALITARIENGLLSLASHGNYALHFEWIRNYGIPIFLPLFLLIYCLLFRDAFRKLSDYIAPCVFSVMTFVKVGCVFQGCCYGAPDPNGIWNENLGYRTFPVQVYDALCMFVIAILCIILIYTLGKKHIGYVYPIGGILFALTKGFWESFRVHRTEWEQHYLGTPFTFWQYWMAILLVFSIIWLILSIRWEKKAIPDFDNMPNMKLPDLSVAHFKAKYREWKTERNNYTHHKKRKKK